MVVVVVVVVVVVSVIIINQPVQSDPMENNVNFVLQQHQLYPNHAINQQHVPNGNQHINQQQIPNGNINPQFPQYVANCNDNLPYAANGINAQYPQHGANGHGHVKGPLIIRSATCK